MIGYTLSSEEHGPNQLVHNAIAAQRHGFDFVGLSDHFHPWISKQGNAPFSWAVLGALAHATTALKLFVEVVCPILRYHPAIVAQAAATIQLMSGGRFYLGVGSGENLNEHIIGQGWPPVAVRQDMLIEAIDIMQQLFTGRQVNYYGAHFTIEQARLYSLPPEPPPIIVSAFGPKAACIAGEIGDGLVSTSPQQHITEAFVRAGGQGKPTFAQIDVCYAKDQDDARQTAYTYWPNTGLKGPLNTELRLPQHFEQAVSMLDEHSATESVVLGPDPEKYIAKYREYQAAGFEHLYFHQIGPDQEGFLKFFEKSVRPRLD